MLDACYRRNVGRIFYSSSACVYPAYNQLDPDTPNCAEDSVCPAAPDSDYGWEKLFSEHLYLAFARNKGMRDFAARADLPGNVASLTALAQARLSAGQPGLARRLLAAVDIDRLDTPLLVSTFMQQCDIFLGLNLGKHPLWGEGCPIPPLEALHAGCVLVAYDVLGNREYLLPEGSGVLISRGDVAAMIGRRHDLTWDRSIDFDQPDWRGDLLRELAATGILHAECGLDYFVHTPGLWGDIPPFALGRTAWDNWLVSAPLARGNVVLNASAVVTAIHQNHDYKHIPQGVHGAPRRGAMGLLLHPPAARPNQSGASGRGRPLGMDAPGPAARRLPGSGRSGPAKGGGRRSYFGYPGPVRPDQHPKRRRGAPASRTGPCRVPVLNCLLVHGLPWVFRTT